MPDQNDPRKPRRFYSRPTNRTLQAYKQWLRAVMRHVGVPDDLTDADWEKGWRQFWAAAGDAPRRRLGKLECELLARGGVPMPEEITGIGMIGYHGEEIAEDAGRGNAESEDLKSRADESEKITAGRANHD